LLVGTSWASRSADSMRYPGSPGMPLGASPLQLRAAASRDARRIDLIDLEGEFGMGRGEVVMPSEHLVSTADGTPLCSDPVRHRHLPSVPLSASPPHPLAASDRHGRRIPAICFLGDVGSKRCQVVVPSEHLAPRADGASRPLCSVVRGGLPNVAERTSPRELPIAMGLHLGGIPRLRFRSECRVGRGQIGLAR